MQLQMEVCDLDECDFLETKFTEYPDTASFYNDPTTTESRKGTIMYFHTKESKPFYLYKPLNLTDQEAIDEWEEKMVELYESSPNNMVFIKNIYWKLEKLSCVLVQRNKKWFEEHIDTLEKVWKTIEEERISGYQHRAPNKRQPKLEQNTKISNYFVQGCLLDLNKIKVTKLENDNQINNMITNNDSMKIIKIRTESLDETKAQL